MTFHKTANVEVLGVAGVDNNWRKVSGKRTSSVYMDGGLAINIEAALDSVADTYKISRDPRDYLLIPCRACSADRPNENMDAFQREELLRFDPRLGRRVYSTFMLKPHFVNHNAANYALSRGVLLDAHFNGQNSADDLVKQAVFEATGSDANFDEFVEVLIGVDASKDPYLAEAYENGSVYRFSMGCDVESTECSVCGKVAANTLQFCKCVRGKHSRVAYPLDCGGERRAFEWCRGTVFAELSGVDDPADKSAEIQEGILRVAGVDPSARSLSDDDVKALVSFSIENARTIPEPLAALIASAISVH